MRHTIAAPSILASLLTLACFFPTPLLSQEVAQEPSPRAAKGLLIPIDLPLRGQGDEFAKQWLTQAAARFPKDAKDRPTIVLEFRVKEGQAGQGSSFERALSLARFLIGGELSRVKVVAYVPKPVVGHSILPILACEQVILSPEASLGDAGIDETTISPTLIGGYREIAEARRTFPAAVAVGLLDKSTTVSRVETSSGVKYVLPDELKEIQSKEAVTAVITVLEGDSRRLTANDLRVKYGFVSHLRSNRGEIASALNLAPEDLEEDPSLARPWKAVRLRLDGPLTQRSARWLREQLALAIDRQKVNFVCLEIESGGGDAIAALVLADYLADLDPAQVRTVAYVVREARGDAALVAFACDQIMMTPDARLGGDGQVDYDLQTIGDVQPQIKAFTALKGKDWSIPLAMLDQNLEIHRYESGQSSTGRYWSQEEHELQPDADAWTRGEPIDVRQGLSADEAVRLGVAHGIAHSLAEIEQAYHLPEAMPRLNTGWAHELVQRLADPRLAGVLLFVAFFALFLEAMSPGIGLPSIISGICFLLFFWSQFLHGTAGWLEVLLFVAGASCIAVEVFFVPGLGVFGLGGIIMVIASIVLASQTFVIPTNAYQLRQLPTSLYMVTAALSGTAVCIFLMRKYLPNAPMIRRMMLTKEAPEELHRRRQRESFAVYDFLLNKRGTVVTPLTPAGKARFGDDLIDVVSADGEYVERQADVYVVEVRGSRVAVRRIT